jgi:hypothetical protein
MPICFAGAVAPGCPSESPWPAKTVRPIQPSYRQNGVKNQKTLIPLHFGNRELHNKLLAQQHPTMG